MDINSVMTDVGNQQNQLKDIGAKTNDVASMLLEGAPRQEELSKSISTTELKDQQSAELMGQSIGHALGVDKGSASNRLTKLAAIKTQASDAAMGLLDQANQMESTDFFTNPIGYIVNNFAADELKDKAGLNLKKAEIATSEMQSINQQIQNGMETARVLNKTVDDKTIADKVELAGIAAKQVSAKMQLDLLGKQADMIKAIQSGDTTMLSAFQHQQSMAMQAQELVMRREDMQFRRVEFANKKEEQQYQYQRDIVADQHWEFGAQLAGKKEGRIAEHEAKMETLASGRFELAKDSFENKMIEEELNSARQKEQDAIKLETQSKTAKTQEERLSLAKQAQSLREEALNYKKNADATKIKVKEAAVSGVVGPYRKALKAYNSTLQLPENNDAAIKVLSNLSKMPKDSDEFKLYQIVTTAALNGSSEYLPYGVTPAGGDTAIEIMRPNLSKGESQFRSQVTDVAKGKVAYDPKDNEGEKRVKFNETARNVWQQKLTDPDSSDVTRLPQLPVMATWQDLSKTKLWNLGLKPMLDNGDTDINGKKLVSILTELVTSKKLSQSDAIAEGSAFIQRSIANNNQQYGYSRQGYAPMQAYPIVLNAANGSRMFNLADPADLTAALVLEGLRSNLITGAAIFGRQELPTVIDFANTPLDIISSGAKQRAGDNANLVSDFMNPKSKNK